MTIKDILNLDVADIMKMNKVELKKTVSKLASAANKRYKRMGETEFLTAAYYGVKRSGGKFSVAKKNLNDLRAEYTRVTSFLKNKQSTLRAAKKSYAEMSERLGGNLTPSEYKDLWEAYHLLEEAEPNFLKIDGSDRIQQFLRDIILQGDRDVDSLVAKGKAEIKRLYEETKNDKEFDMGEFFKTK